MFKKKGEPKTPHILDTIFEELDNNPIGLRQNYIGKKITFIGKIVRIHNHEEPFQVTIAVPEAKHWHNKSADCYDNLFNFSSDQKTNLLILNKHDKVVITGEIYNVTCVSLYLKNTTISKTDHNLGFWKISS